MRSFALAALVLALPSYAQQHAPLTAEAIMARVAANQDRSQAERKHFVYVQHADVQSRRGGRVMCREQTDSRVTPDERGQQQTLLTLDGEAAGEHGQTIVYRELPTTRRTRDGSVKTEKNSESDGEIVVLKDAAHANQEVAIGDTDVDLVENMRDNLLKKNGKDGISANLFPLTSAQQKEMIFHLKGRESKNGHDAFHIVFEPRDQEDFGWKGETWIDANAFEPVMVRTAMSKNIPLAVRLMLGTSIPGLGFTAIYAPQPVEGGEPVWFPVSFGTEFKLNVLFVFHRQIVLSAENRQFERTHVSATIHDDAALQPAPPPR